jgi:hypothetical protein
MSAIKLDYGGIKELAKELRRPASTLYALAAGNDPFYITPGRIAGAEWFAEQWHRLNIPTSWHYRRIHYVFVSQRGETIVVMLNGSPYENTVECWDWLCSTARDAIALELVPQEAFVDHRNAEPIIYLVEPGYSDAYISNTFATGLALPLFPPLPALAFQRPVVPQPYHIEVWAEKTTVNDVLEPLARQFEFNLVTGIGELSATRCREFVDRAQRSERPVRILYVSDFDPGGLSMPVAVARKIEFELDRRGLDLDIQLRPIVLTHQQCIEYDLPRTPIKESERRAARFEARFGEGGTELDALEALHPGLLRQIVADEVGRYWNPDHDSMVEQTCDAIAEQFKEITAAAQEAHHGEIQALKADWQRIVADFGAWRSRAEPTWQAIADKLEQDQPFIDDVTFDPEFAANEDSDPLYDSTRDYVEQCDRYKRHQGKPTERRRPNGGAS